MASSSSSSQKKYDVFLSFRGEDTRHNFVSHLRESLSRSKVLIFIDDNLEKGEEISQSLVDAIEASRISLVIFSENYASSKWCLNELVMILECKEHHGQIVIPVFYGVDPSQVRKQTGSYALAFTEHEQQINMDMVKTWRVALEEAANLSGWDSSVARDGAQLVNTIVSDIRKKLHSVLSNNSNGLIGIDSRIKEILNLLHLESSDIRILGIWGPGGIGKTETANKIFECICHKFEECYLLSNAKEELKQTVLIPSEHRSLPMILKERSSYKSTSDTHPTFLGERSNLKRVLAILDDVDDLMRLQDLLRQKEASFGPGSRIILTSRDRQVLQVADEIYKVKELNHAEALELFNLHAFKTDRPSEFVHLSERVAEYAGGNPLALKVLGSALYGKRRDDWERALKDLSQVSNRGILDVLRVSYEGLDDKEKKLFLYVSTFFLGKDEQLSKQILSSWIGEVKFCMCRLADKALLAVNNNVLEMHNLLRELGKKIIRGDSTNEIGILCDPHKIHRILKRKKGTEAIEGISLDLTEIAELLLDSDAFMGMDRLKVLQFFYSFSSGHRSEVQLSGLEFISDELRYLRWDGYPSECLPAKFCAENLVLLQLKESNVKQLWAGKQNVVNLKQMDLSRSTCLTTLPDLSMAINIKEINLFLCESLEELPPSIQHLTKLEVLNVSFCKSLRRLPLRLDSPVLRKLDLRGSGKVERCPKTSSGNLEYFSFSGVGIKDLPQSSINALEVLYLWGCPNVTKFPEVSEKIRELELVGTGIKEIPPSIEFCTRLTKLIMDDCKELSGIPTGICKLKSLEELSLWGCSKLKLFPEIQEPLLNLQMLDLSYCKNLEWRPDSFHNLRSLRNLYLPGTMIKDLSSSGLLSRVQYLTIDGCKFDVQPWRQLLGLPSLMDLHLRSGSLMEIPISFCSLMHDLVLLDLGQNKFVTLPSNFQQLSKLESLKLEECRGLLSLPELPECLIQFKANDCESQERISPGRGKQLTRLLGNCCKL